MIVVDEYLAVHVLRGRWPERLPDDELALPVYWTLPHRASNMDWWPFQNSIRKISPTGWR